MDAGWHAHTHDRLLRRLGPCIADRHGHQGRACCAGQGRCAHHIDSVVAGNKAPGDFDQFVLPRHIGLYAGVPQEVPAIMVQRICGTGFELFRQAGKQIQSGAADVALVVDPESMTRNPIAAFDHRGGFKLGAPVG